MAGEERHEQMYGDTAVVRAMARSMRERGREIRDDADDLDHCVEAVPWTGSAADAMRRLSGERTRGLRRCADAHDAAADALDRHAGEVDRVVEVLSAVGQEAQHLVGAAADGVADWLGDRLPEL